MKKKIVSLVIVGLVLASSVFGQECVWETEIYSRSPSNYTISNPVSFTLDFGVGPVEVAGSGTPNYWGILVKWDIGEVFSERLPNTTLSHTFIMDLPLQSYYEVAWVGFDDEIGGLKPYEEYLEEVGACEPTPDYIFEVVELAGPVIIDVPVDLPLDMLAFAGTLFTDLGSLITMAVGVPLGFVVIKKIISLV